MKLNIKSVKGDKIEVEADPSDTILQLKGIIEQALPDRVSPLEQRLIYRGHVLKDDITVESCNIQDGHTIIMVSGSKPTAAASASSLPSSVNDTTPLNASQPDIGQPDIGQPDMGQPDMGGMAGMAGMAGMDPSALLQNPQLMMNLMNNPMVQATMQQVASNPQLLQSMIQSNPLLSNMMQSNPQMQAMFNNPALMQQLMNPATIQAALSMGQMFSGQQPVASPSNEQPEQQAQPAQQPPPFNFASLFQQPPPQANGTAPAQPPPFNFASLFQQPPPQANATAPAQPAAQPTPFNFASLFQQPPPQANATAPAQPAAQPTPFNFASLFQQPPPQANATAPAQPAAQPTPEILYREQLNQLNEMGFSVSSANIQALVATGGNVEAAVNILLSQL